MKSRFWILLEKKLTGIASPDELKELNELIASNEEYRHVAEAVYSTWVRQKVNEWVRAGNESPNRTISHHFKNIAMIRNYLKIAIRNLQKQKIFAFINVFGLSVGISCFTLLMLFAINEFSFDKFHKNAANIYRPYSWDRLASPPTAYTDVSGSSSASLGEAMKQNIPDVVDFVRMRLPWGENLIRANNQVNRISLSFADPSFFSVFSFPLKYGSTTSALHELTDIVVTESRARQLFGTSNVVGKIVEIQIGTTIKPFTIAAFWAIIGFPLPIGACFLSGIAGIRPSSKPTCCLSQEARCRAMRRDLPHL